MFERWEGKAVTTNCSPPELLCYIANVPCSVCFSIANEQRSKLTEAHGSYYQRGVAHAPGDNWPDACVACWRGRVCDRPYVDFFACFHTISLERSCSGNFHFNIHVLVVHNSLVLLIGLLVACSASTDADRQTDRPSTVTLAAHPRRGLIIMDSPFLALHWASNESCTMLTYLQLLSIDADSVLCIHHQTAGWRFQESLQCLLQ